MGDLQPHQIVDRRPVRVRQRVLPVRPGLGFGGPADHMRKSQNVDLTPFDARLVLEVGDLVAGPGQIERGGKQEVGVANRKRAALRRSVGVDDRRQALRPGMAVGVLEVEAAAVPIERFIGGP